MKRTCLPLLVFGLLPLLYPRCSQSPTQSSGGFEWDARTMAVSGSARRPDGAPAVGALVRVCAQDYLAPLQTLPTEQITAVARTALTDSLGAFRIDSLDTGAYSLEVLAGLGRSVAIGARFLFAADTPHYALPELSLDTTGAISGHIDTTGGLKRLFVRVFGMQRLAPVRADGSFVVTDLPPSTYALQIQSQDPWIEPLTLGPIELMAGRTVDLGSVTMQVDTAADSMTVRLILDRMGLTHVPVSAVCSQTSGRVRSMALSHVAVESFPEELGRLAAIETLWVTFNPLLTTLPASIGRLESLKELYTNTCPLFDSLPPEIGNCTSLAKLQIINTALRTLPQSIDGCVSLTSLEVIDGALGSLPQSIIGLNNLETCNFSGNQICSVSDTLAAWLDRNQPGWSHTQTCP